MTIRVAEIVCDTPIGPIMSLPPEVRIRTGPVYLAGPAVWEVVVNLPVYSPKLAFRAFLALPDTIEIDGRIYCKAGMRGADCTAWYKTKRK